ncbi:hypothetical protein [Mycobacterium bohemicum]|uniref:hypothetical protein n=1 Tax=Mycobacterium bohemicum TaxID=56425 RepID=UPI0011126E70|nr:hypothetical protein [Mycobacterium bohemicum]MCV6972458.1 hypothetical protein [Mycobacterium bohemicum]
MVDPFVLPTVNATPSVNCWVSAMPSFPQKCHDHGTPAAGAMRRVVVILVFEGVKLLDAAGPAEAFSEATELNTTPGSLCRTLLCP